MPRDLGLCRPRALDGTRLRAWAGQYKDTLGSWTTVASGCGRGSPVYACYWCVLAAADRPMNLVRYPRRRGTARFGYPEPTGVSCAEQVGSAGDPALVAAYNPVLVAACNPVLVTACNPVQVAA